MTSNPFRIPSDNSHRIILHQPDRRQTDFERLEDIGADALGAARAALGAMTDLPYELFKPLQFHERVLRDAVKQRRMVGQEFRDAVDHLLEAASDLPDDDTARETVQRLIQCLTEALAMSHRVADLLAAERDIGLHRGIRM
jgi:hypothetical protein